MYEKKIKFLLKGLDPVLALEVYNTEPKTTANVLDYLERREKFDFIMDKKINPKKTSNEQMDTVVKNMQGFQSALDKIANKFALLKVNQVHLVIQTAREGVNPAPGGNHEDQVMVRVEDRQGKVLTAQLQERGYASIVRSQCMTVVIVKNHGGRKRSQWLLLLIGETRCPADKIFSLARQDMYRREG